MPDSLDVVAGRIARLALHEVPGLGKVGSGPVITVARDTTNGKISVGFNTGVPAKVAKVLQDAIDAQKDRISKGQVIVVRTDPLAKDGGHSEINALNPLILARQEKLKRNLTETELRTFEVSNVWLQGVRRLTTAPRCEHCARILRGVSITKSVFLAEGGRMGEISVPQRGAVKRAGTSQFKPVTTVKGTIGAVRGIPAIEGGEISGPPNGTVKRTDVSEPEPETSAGVSTVPRRGGAGGRGMAEAAVSGLLTAAWVIAEPLIKKWFAENYLKDKWAVEERKMVVDAINANLWRFNILVVTSMAEIQKARAAGRRVTLHVAVDTDWANTDYGPAQTKAEVTYYSLLYEGDTPVHWPLFQRHNWFIDWFGARITTRRQTFDFPL